MRLRDRGLQRDDREVATRATVDEQEPLTPEDEDEDDDE